MFQNSRAQDVRNPDKVTRSNDHTICKQATTQDWKKKSSMSQLELRLHGGLTKEKQQNRDTKAM